MHPGCEFHLIRTTEELTAFESQWRALWMQDPLAKPFQAAEWLLPWWRQFGNEHLCSVAIVREGECIGFLPFYVYFDVQKRQKQLLLLGVGTTDYLDGVFAPQCSAEEIADTVEFLRSRVEHDLFCVSQLPSQSRLLQSLQQSDARVSLSPSDPCSRMAAVSMAELPQKIRRNAMYYRNRALRSGRLELLQADESNWAEVFAQLRSLHSQRWQERGEEGVLADQRVVAWHREAIPLLLRAGLLRLMALRSNHEIIAVLYSLIDRKGPDRAQYFYVTAYSPEHAELRPGTLLIAYAVEHAAREGVTTIDMLRGDEGYKQIWHMEKTPTWCVTRFAAAAERERTEAETAA